MEKIFRQYRSKQGEVWQLGRHEGAFWVLPEEGGQPFRPQKVVCLSLRTNRARLSSAAPAEPGLETYLGLVIESARAWKLRPERIEVGDAGLAEALGARLAPEKVPVAVCEGVPALTALFEEWDHLVTSDPPPGALSAPGVTVERIAAFARAAARFAEAAPWRHLTDSMDILIFETEGLPIELRCARLLGTRLSPGILFEPDELGEWDEEAEDGEEAAAREEEAPASEEGRWQVRLCPPDKTPAEDVELWMEHGLPLANPTAYPVAAWAQLGKPARRPDDILLSWFEAILSALASTTEEEMDSGRWEKEVIAFDRPVRLGLSLPEVLRPAHAEEWALDEAENDAPEEIRMGFALITEAMAAWGRRQNHLARRAVALWPDCIDGWLILARRTVDREAAKELYAKAMAAGERLIPGIRERDAGHRDDFDRHEVVPYIWACIGFAVALWDLGEREEAISLLRETLALDTRDSPKVRFLLAHALLAEQRDGEARELLINFDKDIADWQYAQALLTYRRQGSSSAASRQLGLALEADRRMVKPLLGGDPELPFGQIGWGAAETALIQEVWASTPGARKWMRAESAGNKRNSRKQRR